MGSSGVIASLFGRFKLWILGVGAALAALAAILLRVYAAGKDSIRDKQNREILRRVERARDIEDETEQLSDRAVVDELRRGGWLRDDADQ